MAREGYESLLTEVTMPGSDTRDEDGYKNMFASVWLKTELHDTAEENIDLGEDSETEPVVIQEPIRKTLLPKSQTPAKRQNMKQLNCELCEYTTTYKNCLELHVLGHADTKDYRCKHCQFATKLPTSLQRHMKAKHAPDLESGQTINCELCDYRTVYKWNLRSHMRKHCEDKLYKCTQCEYVTAYKHNYQKHAKTHTVEKNVMFKCDKCHFKTKYIGHITRHLAKIHNEITETAFRCAHCDFCTVTKWRLKIHLNKSEQKDSLNCSHCDFVSSYSCALKKHKRDDHYNATFMKTTPNESTEEPREDQYEADYEFLEPNSTTTKKSKKRRKGENSEEFNMSPDCVDWKSIKVLESADKKKPFQCTTCIYSSRFKASVQRHYQRHHTGEKIKPYQCLNCDFSTKTKDQIALHNKRSKSETVVECKLCDFKTEFKCSFVVHQKSHYPFSCSKCSYKCKSKYDLSKHYNYAHLDGIWKCQYCDYRAPRKDTLMAHETVHTGYKPFACGLCSYTSLRKSLLNIHFRRFHSELRDDVVVVSKDKIDALKVIEESEESNLKGFEL